VEANALITNEINAIVGAQLTQVCQPILLGKIPAEWTPVIALHKEVYEAGLARIKPGTAFGALSDFVNGFGAKRGLKTAIQLHGCGYGDDGPSYTLRSQSEKARDLRIEKGNAFVWKPTAMSADGKIQFTFGGPVLVTAQGCEALFRREHGIVSIS
jgi:methionine aminopeptidase